MAKRRSWHYPEPIQMADKRFGFFPQAFIWHGRRYQVQRVERAWTVSRQRLRCRVERRCFRVHTREGIFDLYQDLLANTWHLERVLA
ncbi:MAG: DUF6504 family protein [Chloroflexota bacterium]